MPPMSSGVPLRLSALRCEQIGRQGRREGALGRVRRHVAGQDRVDPDPVDPELPRGRPHHHVDGSLGARVGRHADLGRRGRRRRDGDQRAAVLAHRQRRMAKRRGGADDVELAAEPPGCCRRAAGTARGSRSRRWRRRCRGGRPASRATATAASTCSEFVTSQTATRICAPATSAAQLRGGRVEHVLPARGDGHHGTLAGEAGGDAAADAGPAAGDQGMCAFERLRCHAQNYSVMAKQCPPRGYRTVTRNVTEATRA